MENKISYIIRGSAFKVYNALGPGLFESVYEIALKHELEQSGCKVENQIGIPLIYKDISFENGFRIDLLVNDLVIVEIKSVEALNPVHFKQVQTYLKMTNLKLGLLINFNSSNLASDIKRIVNKL
jgi:GxxExxY protein